MGSVWRSTRKTEMPFGSLKRSGWGALSVRSEPAAGCALRNASSSGNASSGVGASATGGGGLGGGVGPGRRRRFAERFVLRERQLGRGRLGYGRWGGGALRHRWGGGGGGRGRRRRGLARAGGDGGDQQDGELGRAHV